MIKYTLTEQRILSLLSDGIGKTEDELHFCLSDDLADPKTVRYHISNLRKKLQGIGQDISCNRHSRKYYRVRIVTSADEQ